MVLLLIFNEIKNKLDTDPQKEYNMYSLWGFFIYEKRNKNTLAVI